MSSVSSSSLSLKGVVKYDPTKAFTSDFSSIKTKIITAVVAEHAEIGNLLRAGQVFDLPPYPVRVTLPPSPGIDGFQQLKHKELVERTFTQEVAVYGRYAQVTQLLNCFLDKSFVERLHSMSTTALNAFTVGNPMLYWQEICKLAEGDLSTSKFVKFKTLLLGVSEIFTSRTGTNSVDQGVHISMSLRKLIKLGREFRNDESLMQQLEAYAYLSNLSSEYSKAQEALNIHALTDEGIRTSFPKDIGQVRSLAEGMRAARAEQKANLAKTGNLPSQQVRCTKCHPSSRGGLSHTTSEHRGRAWNDPKDDSKSEGADGDRVPNNREMKKNKHSSKERGASKDKREKRESVGAVGEQFHSLHTTMRTGSLNPGDLSMPQLSGSMKRRVTVGEKPLSLDTGTQALVEPNRTWLSNTKYETVSLSTVAGPVDLNVVGEHKILGGKAAYSESAAVGLANFAHIEVNYDIKGITTSCSEMDRITGRPIKKVEAFVFQRRDRKNYPEPESSSELTFRVQNEGDCKSLFLLERPSRHFSNGVGKRGANSESASGGSDSDSSSADGEGSDVSSSDEGGEDE
jgi:hypothetical protein